MELRKGPRGGGRDLDKIIDHVVGAEESYLVQLGGPRQVASGAPRERVRPVREAILETLTARARGGPVEGGTHPKRPWPPRYFVRRAAWHVLDHAWEIEDRVTQPAG